MSSEGTLKIALRAKRGGGGGAPRPRIAPVVSMLKTIGLAQSLFREGDKDGDSTFDYAENLDQLIETELISKGVAQGTSDGYRIEVCSGSSAPEFLWMAIARPMSGQGVHYAINQEGVLFVKDGPFVLDRADCKITGGKPTR